MEVCLDLLFWWYMVHDGYTYTVLPVSHKYEQYHPALLSCYGPLLCKEKGVLGRKRRVLKMCRHNLEAWKVDDELEEEAFINNDI